MEPGEEKFSTSVAKQLRLGRSDVATRPSRAWHRQEIDSLRSNIGASFLCRSQGHSSDSHSIEGRWSVVQARETDEMNSTASEGSLHTSVQPACNGNSGGRRLCHTYVRLLGTVSSRPRSPETMNNPGGPAEMATLDKATWRAPLQAIGPLLSGSVAGEFLGTNRA